MDICDLYIPTDIMNIIYDYKEGMEIYDHKKYSRLVYDNYCDFRSALVEAFNNESWVLNTNFSLVDLNKINFAFNPIRNAQHIMKCKKNEFSVRDLKKSLCYIDKYIFSKTGQNDETPWIIIGKFDKYYFFIEAGCDYTGWNCCGNYGKIIWATNYTDLYKYGLTDKIRGFMEEK